MLSKLTVLSHASAERYVRWIAQPWLYLGVLALLILILCAGLPGVIYSETISPLSRSPMVSSQVSLQVFLEVPLLIDNDQARFQLYQ